MFHLGDLRALQLVKNKIHVFAEELSPAQLTGFAFSVCKSADLV